MPGVPLNLKSKAHIYRYSQDLDLACTELQSRLNNPCYYTQVEGDKGADKSHSGDDLFKSGDKVAWLVGHGSKSNIKIGDKDHIKYIYFSNIMKWLIQKKFTIVVDTCCQSQSRKYKFKKDYKNDIRYFCVPNSWSTTQNQDYDTLDEWWDANQFAEVT